MQYTFSARSAATMSPVTRKGKKKAPTKITASVISVDKAGLRLKFKLPRSGDNNEEAAYNHTRNYMKGQSLSASSSGVLSSEPNSRENSNLNIVEGKVNSDNSETSEGPPTCEVCGKTFPSMKSLYGHLRSHPDRDYRGAKPPKPKSTMRTTSDENQSRAKRSQRDDCQQARAYHAQTLIMMSQNIRDSWGSVYHTQGLEGPTESDNKAADMIIYQCSARGRTTCNSHQALGGQTAGSHKKQKSNSDDIVHDGPSGLVARGAVTTVHKCKECHETFGSGQALGGHMRRHWTGPPSSSSGSGVVFGEEKNGRGRGCDHARPSPSVVVGSGEEENRMGRDRDFTGLPDSVVPVSGEEENGRGRDRGFDLNQAAQSEE